ncbi:MAG: pilus assembly protein [Actinomycetota bacterium]|nr:pilus assembly protein [Actinomycetota bacterium]
MSERAVSSPPTLSTSRPRHGRRCRRGDQSGVAVLEFALVVPFLLFMILGLVTFGLMLAEKQKVTSTAADAARAGLGSPGTETAAAATRITAVMGTPGTDYTSTQVKGACPGTESSHQCLTVTITYDYKNHPLVPATNLPGLHLFTPDTINATAVVRLD